MVEICDEVSMTGVTVVALPRSCRPEGTPSPVDPPDCKGGPSSPRRPIEFKVARVPSATSSRQSLRARLTGSDGRAG